jgi:gamma-glutamyltranspeptidase/glutathione hydrolase
MNITTLSHLVAGVIAAGVVACAPARAAEAPRPGVFWGGETAEAGALEARDLAKRGTMGVASHAMVAACHDRSVEIGLEILKRGGSAADAFIAVTFADYVQTPGASSLGGPMGALVYDARTGEVASLGAPLKTVASVSGQWTASETAIGKQVLVPGAVVGLEALHRRYGRLPWADLVGPAARMAREGFVITPLYAAIISAYGASLRGAGYGQATYFHPDGASYRVGETLKLPAMADTLDGIALHGAAYVQTGPWAKAAVAAVRAHGGEMTAADLADYRPEWTPPLRITYRGRVVYGVSGHDSGGARLLLALKALEHGDIVALGHPSQSLDGLEAMVRISRAVAAEPALNSHAFFEDPAGPAALLTGPRASEIWTDVQAKINRSPLPAPGSHSYAVAVVDAQGDAVAGTHTIESLPFGTNGIFVGGVPLNNTGVLHPYAADSAYATPPGSYLIEPISAVLAFESDKLVLAGSTFSASLWPGDFQMVSSILDFGWSPERVALTPRFGGYGLDLAKMSVDLSVNVIDKRYTAKVVEAMKARGVSLTQAGYVDTGMLVMIKRDPGAGQMSGFTPEGLSEGRAAGY